MVLSKRYYRNSNSKEDKLECIDKTLVGAQKSDVSMILCTRSDRQEKSAFPE